MPAERFFLKNVPADRCQINGIDPAVAVGVAKKDKGVARNNLVAGLNPDLAVGADKTGAAFASRRIDIEQVTFANKDMLFDRRYFV